MHLIECNPSYTHVRLSSGRETIVDFTRYPAPRVENNTALPANRSETTCIGSNVSIHNVCNHNYSTGDW